MKNEKSPISIIIDDSGVVNMFHFHHLCVEHPLLYPLEFTRRFAKVCGRYGIKGKFSFVPNPAGLGRLDGKKVSQVPSKLIKDHVKEVKKNIEPLFSITPEVLTHFMAYDLKRNAMTLTNEESYFSKLSKEEIRDYVGLALEILCNLGLNPSGVTSPWSCGLDNEENYAKGIGMAFKKVMKKDSSFYFLHSGDHIQEPVIMCNSPETGKVVTIPANTPDPFWCANLPEKTLSARKKIKANIDDLLSPDGKNGLIRELYEKKLPIILLTHAQCLFSDGRYIGLEGLEALAGRINKVFGSSVEWMTFEELAGKWKYKNENSFF